MLWFEQMSVVVHNPFQIIDRACICLCVYFLRMCPLFVNEKAVARGTDPYP